MSNVSIHITGNQSIQLMRMARKDNAVRVVPASGHGLCELSQDVRSVGDLPAESLWTALGISDGNPLKLLVPNDDSRRWTTHGANGLKTELLSVELPHDSFMELRPGFGRHAIGWPSDLRIFIDSPGLAIVGGSRSLMRSVEKERISSLQAFLRLLAFVDECCGTYYRSPSQPMSSEVLYDKIDKPTRFTNPTGIQAFLQSARGIDGLPLARKAARYALDNSGSPMESHLTHALTLPPRYAGLSMSAPLLNQQLVLDESDWKLLRHDSLRPDLQWPDYKVLAEYLGDKDHSSKGARTEDKNRMQDYATTPYTAFPLMYDDVRNAAAINRTALMIAREFAKRGAKNEMSRLRRIMRDEDFLGRQRVLVGTLLPPITRYDS